jgi:hypothetical protein
LPKQADGTGFWFISWTRFYWFGVMQLDDEKCPAENNEECPKIKANPGDRINTDFFGYHRWL